MISLGLAAAVIRYVHTIAFRPLLVVVRKNWKTRQSFRCGGLRLTTVLIPECYVAPPPIMGEIMLPIAIERNTAASLFFPTSPKLAAVRFMRWSIYPSSAFAQILMP
jgi:hypothetical protein